ncbi:hypothetical protein CDAR_295171 [Caerostris darwini]|uniref:Uncharacterized protein n=1 Tax=Caerostris darwini TaxID=1538125 RepID=A0AAV4SIR3_9ARAC|nr:hypothetical protein CDAR_295171 [Caerostris darwini]
MGKPPCMKCTNVHLFCITYVCMKKRRNPKLGWIVTHVKKKKGNVLSEGFGCHGDGREVGKARGAKYSEMIGPLQCRSCESPSNEAITLKEKK